MKPTRRLIDANALKRLRDDYIQGRIKFDGNEYDLIDKCPTIDAVEVVRCKDCKTYSNGTCWKMRGKMKSDDFCSCGVRRNNNG